MFNTIAHSNEQNNDFQNPLTAKNEAIISIEYKHPPIGAETIN